MKTKSALEKLRYTFTFGKYKGEALRSVVLKDRSYIIWCLKTVDRFRIDEDEFIALKFIFQEIDSAFEKKVPYVIKYTDALVSAYEAYLSHEEDDCDYEEDCDYGYKSSYEEHGGAFGYDDDTINSAFEGDPSNCWNVD